MLLLKKAKELADKIVSQLQPHCEVIQIAGSIRRENYEVKDIEIVCIPKRVTTGAIDMFTNKPADIVVSPLFASVVSNLGTVLKGKPDGRYMQIKINDKVVLDLFIPQPADYYRQLAIRTGSSSYSHNTIAKAWLKKGWCGTANGLRLQLECNCYERGEKHVWIIKQGIIPTMPPAWNSEKDFFEWLGIQYLEPKYRTV